MNRFLILILLVVASFQTALAQDFGSQFKTLFDKQDFAGQERILRVWENARSDDPELYVSYFNYYFAKSRDEKLTLTKQPVSKESVKITKTDDEKTVAYIGGQVSYIKADFDKGIVYIDKGISKFPNRLDMRFGKVYALGQITDYKAFTDEIVKIIDYSEVNKNQWLWRDGKPIEDGRKFMFNAVQDYVAQLFDAGDKYVGNIKTIAETVLKYYPDSIENLSNLAIYHLIKQDYENALVPLLKAEKLAPTDFIVLNNIAFCYYNKGDKAHALKYYELVLKHGDERAQAQAQEKLNELKKKN